MTRNVWSCERSCVQKKKKGGYLQLATTYFPGLQIYIGQIGDKKNKQRETGVFIVSSDTLDIVDIDLSNLRYKMTSRVIGLSSWSSTHSHPDNPNKALQMLIIQSSLLLAILTQIVVLAAPIPPNGVSLNARAPLLNDDALLSRANPEGSNQESHTPEPRTFTFDYVCLPLGLSIPAGRGTSPTHGNFLIPCLMSLLFLTCYNLNRSRYVFHHLTDSSTLAHIVVILSPK